MASLESTPLALLSSAVNGPSSSIHGNDDDHDNIYNNSNNNLPPSANPSTVNSPSATNILPAPPRRLPPPPPPSSAAGNVAAPLSRDIPGESATAPLIAAFPDNDSSSSSGLGSSDLSSTVLPSCSGGGNSSVGAESLSDDTKDEDDVAMLDVAANTSTMDDVTIIGGTGERTSMTLFFYFI